MTDTAQEKKFPVTEDIKEAMALIKRGTDTLLVEEELEQKLARSKATGKPLRIKLGLDPTAPDIHLGHTVVLNKLRQFQNLGHTVIFLVGDFTSAIGDPSGRTDMRKMMTPETIQHNCDCFKKQMERFIEFGEGKAQMVNNADWLLKLNYIELLRDVGACFSVNNMLRAKCYEQRMAKGLSFLEFNYMIMQSYDFLQLFKKHGCIMQLGGDDQWSNMLAGVELIRRKEQKPAYCMTCKLLTTSDGRKMGKTE